MSIPARSVPCWATPTPCAGMNKFNYTMTQHHKPTSSLMQPSSPSKLSAGIIMQHATQAMASTCSQHHYSVGSTVCLHTPVSWPQLLHTRPHCRHTCRPWYPPASHQSHARVLPHLHGSSRQQPAMWAANPLCHYGNEYGVLAGATSSVKKEYGHATITFKACHFGCT